MLLYTHNGLIFSTMEFKSANGEILVFSIAHWLITSFLVGNVFFENKLG